MSDEKKRARERAAATSGDALDHERAAWDSYRAGEGLHGFLLELVGKFIYVEGIRINYRGVLQRVLWHSNGMPAGLVFAPGSQRISYFQRSGPEANYTYTHKEERLVPYECVHDVGVEGWVERMWEKP